MNTLDKPDDFLKYFNVVFNSYKLGNSKMDPSHFSDIITRLNCAPERLLFVDDTEAYCATARKIGMKAIRFVDRPSFLVDIVQFCPIHRE